MCLIPEVNLWILLCLAVKDHFFPITFTTLECVRSAMTEAISFGSSIQLFQYRDFNQFSLSNAASSASMISGVRDAFSNLKDRIYIVGKASQIGALSAVHSVSSCYL